MSTIARWTDDNVCYHIREFRWWWGNRLPYRISTELWYYRQWIYYSDSSARSWVLFGGGIAIGVGLTLTVFLLL